MLSRLRRFLIPQTPSRSQVQFWFWLSLTFAAIYAILGLRQGFGSEYVVQDDARQHVFWMRRFLDPGLFPNDLIADYFQSTAPPGYVTLYRIASASGIDPLLFNKLLPFALGLVTASYCFAVCFQMLPVPFAGFVATLLLNQNLWLQDDLVSGIARAFVYPIFLAFVYYLLRQALLPCLVTIALQGLIYPQLVFVMAAVLVLRLLWWHNGLKLSRHRSDYWLSGLGLAVAFVVLLPYALGNSAYDPIVTVAEARLMPEFQEQGRTRLFVGNLWQYWLTEERTGAFLWVMPLCLLSIPILPLVLRSGGRGKVTVSDAVTNITPNTVPNTTSGSLAKRVRHTSLLVQVTLASLLVFLAAHLLMFTLYLPSRYSQNTFQIVTALSGAIVTTLVLNAVFHWAEPVKQRKRQTGALVAIVGLGAVLLLSPYLWEFPKQTRVFAVGEYPAVYQFFAAQPKDIMIASLAREADNLPTFAQRSILTSREYSVPYQLGYYRQIYQRTADLIRAQYSPDRREVESFVQRYGVDFWLIDRAYLQRPFSSNPGESRITLWLQQFQPTTAEVTARLEQGATPLIRRRLNRCSVLKEKNLVILSAACLIEND